jgi:hypothetical protein
LSLAEPCQGYIVWNITPILENRQNLKNELLAGDEVLTPPLARSAGREVAPPEISQQGSQLNLTHVDGLPWRAFTLYRWDQNHWRFQQILRVNHLQLSPGNWALAAVSRDGAESLARVVRVP